MQIKVTLCRVLAKATGGQKGRLLLREHVTSFAPLGISALLLGENVGKVLVQRLHAECFEFSGHPARQFIVRLLNMHNFLSKLQKSSSFRAEWLF